MEGNGIRERSITKNSYFVEDEVVLNEMITAFIQSVAAHSGWSSQMFHKHRVGMAIAKG